MLFDRVMQIGRHALAFLNHRRHQRAFAMRKEDFQKEVDDDAEREDGKGNPGFCEASLELTLAQRGVRNDADVVRRSDPQAHFLGVVEVLAAVGEDACALDERVESVVLGDFRARKAVLPAVEVVVADRERVVRHAPSHGFTRNEPRLQAEARAESDALGTEELAEFFGRDIDDRRRKAGFVETNVGGGLERLVSASDAPHALDLDAVPAPDFGQALGRGDAVAFAAVVEQQEVPLVGKEHATAVGLHGRLEMRRRRGLVADSRQSCHQQQSGYDPGGFH